MRPPAGCKRNIKTCGDHQYVVNKEQLRKMIAEVASVHGAAVRPLFSESTTPPAHPSSSLHSQVTKIDPKAREVKWQTTRLLVVNGPPAKSFSPVEAARKAGIPVLFADSVVLRELKIRGVNVPDLPNYTTTPPPGASATSAAGAKRARSAEGGRATDFRRPRTAPAAPRTATAASPDLLEQWERSSAAELAGFGADSRETLTSLAKELLPQASNPRKQAQHTPMLTSALKAVASIGKRCTRCDRDDEVQLWFAYPTAPRVGCRRCAREIRDNWNMLSFGQITQLAEAYDQNFKQPIIEL